MILETLTLNNFGLYRGEQTLDLRPIRNNGRRRPIILIGGINGGGKTTIFDAVQLALYGSRGKYSKRSNVAYDEFLRESIHRGTAPSTGACVSLTLRIGAAGQEHVYEIRRSWGQRGQTLRERIHAYKDGESDQWLTEHWTDLIEEVIPMGISQLFFFDADKVRFLADDETCSGALENAIKSLLGLDLAERLIADAAILEARLTQQNGTSQISSDVTNLETLLEAKEGELQHKKTERASLENQRLRAENELESARRQFEAEGGHHWEQRADRVKKLAEHEHAEMELRGQIAILASGPLSLALVPKILQAVATQDSKETETRERRVIYELLADRDAQLLRALKTRRIDSDIIETVDKLQRADRKSWNADGEAVIRLQLSEPARNLLLELQNGALGDLQHEVQRLIKHMHDRIRDRESLQRSLNQTPEDSDIAVLVSKFNDASARFAVLCDQAKRTDEEIRQLTVQRDDLSRKIQKSRRETVERQIQSEERARLAQLAIRIQETMKEYLIRATASKIDRLANLITDSFRFLLRKKTLVRRIQIDPKTFAISIFDDGGHAVPKQQLSEGEKQIFAISVLWGLAQASPRPLPAIIDTPMARLDSVHRNHLIGQYFPNASHQVIILSTDTEVDQQFYSDL